MGGRRTRSRKKRKWSAADIASAFERSGDACWQYQITTKRVRLTPQGQILLAVEGAFSLKQFIKSIEPPDRRILIALVRRALHERKPFAQTLRRLRSDGRLQWLSVKGAVSRQGRHRLLLGTISDITESYAALEDLRLQHERMSLALDASRIGFWDWDMITDEVTSSPMHDLLTGRAVQSAQPLKLEDIHVDDRARVRSERDRAIREKSDFSSEFRVYWPDGSVHWVFSRGRCSYDRNGKPYRMTGTTKETTDRKHMEDELRAARAKAETSSTAKTQFVANMSHEIRTPINAILGLTELLLNNSHDAVTTRKLQLIEGAAEGLLEVVNDVLDFSKIEANRLNLDVVSFSPAVLLKEIIELYLPQAWRKQLSLRLEGNMSDSLRLYGDSGRLRQVLMNLLSNAVKFTEHGGVILRASHQIVGDQARLHVEVSDTGIGVPNELKPRLFTPFVQGDATAARRFGGSGLGLSICQKIMNLMGTELCFESTPGRGSRFWFDVTLPLAGERDSRANYLHGPNARDHSPEPGESLGRVLLVEDNSLNLEIASDTLILLGYTVRTAASGQEAIDILKMANFDIVLMDCQMPNIDGYEATMLIRAGAGGVLNPEIPIIALTASAMSGDREKCLASGMSDFLAKPIRQRDLAEKLDTWTKSQPKKAAL